MSLKEREISEKDSLTAEDVLNEYLCSKAFLFYKDAFKNSENIRNHIGITGLPFTKGGYGCFLHISVFLSTLAIQVLIMEGEKPFRSKMNNNKKHGITIFELLEPLVDVFEEADHTMIVADMPGMDEKDISIDLKDDILQISATTSEKNYQKELLLKESFTKDKLVRSYKNGILKIILMK